MACDRHVAELNRRHAAGLLIWTWSGLGNLDGLRPTMWRYYMLHSWTCGMWSGSYLIWSCSGDSSIMPCDRLRSLMCDMLLGSWSGSDQLDG